MQIVCKLYANHVCTIRASHTMLYEPFVLLYFRNIRTYVHEEIIRIYIRIIRIRFTYNLHITFTYDLHIIYIWFTYDLHMINRTWYVIICDLHIDRPTSITRNSLKSIKIYADQRESMNIDQNPRTSTKITDSLRGNSRPRGFEASWLGFFFRQTWNQFRKIM